MNTLPPLARAPLLVLGLAALVTGVLAGLARVGVVVADFGAMQAGAHAALMICAFFGTVIRLARAVALGGLWPYLGPALAGELAPLVARLIEGGTPTAGAPANTQAQTDTSYKTTLLAESRSTA